VGKSGHNIKNKEKERIKRKEIIEKKRKGKES
jgi:hypothetical protein